MSGRLDSLAWVSSLNSAKSSSSRAILSLNWLVELAGVGGAEMEKLVGFSSGLSSSLSEEMFVFLVATSAFNRGNASSKDSRLASRFSSLYLHSPPRPSPEFQRINFIRELRKCRNKEIGRASCRERVSSPV